MGNTATVIDYCDSCEEILALKYYEESGNYWCKACSPESAEAIADTPTQTNTNSNPLSVTSTGVTKPLSARIAKAITPSVDSQ